MPTPYDSPAVRSTLPSWESLRSSLWFWPAVASLLGFGLATVLGNVQPLGSSRLADLAWPGDLDSASTFLQVVASSVITVTSLTFSLVVVALQLASQQFSPRLLREFARDLVTQAVLGTLVTTFVFCITVLRGLDSASEIPSLALAVAFLLALLSVCALLGFLGHIARIVRVDTMMARVHEQALSTMRDYYLEYGEEVEGSELPQDLEGSVFLLAGKSGFVQEVDVAGLVRAADEQDGVLSVLVRPGDQVTVGTPLARALVAADRRERLEQAVRASLELGYERTLEQDVALGLRQLTDIAVKALSPGINDPTTAGHAIGHVSDLLARLQGRRLGPVVHCGKDGVARVQTPDRDMRYYLDLVVAPVRRYGSSEPTVLVALLRMLRDVALATRDDEQREQIARQADLVVATLPPDMLDADAEAVHDGQRRVLAALRGDVLAAYGDRAGETRSM